MIKVHLNIRILILHVLFCSRREKRDHLSFLFFWGSFTFIFFIWNFPHRSSEVRPERLSIMPSNAVTNPNTSAFKAPDYSDSPAKRMVRSTRQTQKQIQRYSSEFMALIHCGMMSCRLVMIFLLSSVKLTAAGVSVMKDVMIHTVIAFLWHSPKENAIVTTVNTITIVSVYKCT